MLSSEGGCDINIVLSQILRTMTFSLLVYKSSSSSLEVGISAQGHQSNISTDILIDIIA